MRRTASQIARDSVAADVIERAGVDVTPAGGLAVGTPSVALTRPKIVELGADTSSGAAFLAWSDESTAAEAPTVHCLRRFMALSRSGSVDSYLEFARQFGVLGMRPRRLEAQRLNWIESLDDWKRLAERMDAIVSTTVCIRAGESVPVETLRLLVMPEIAEVWSALPVDREHSVVRHLICLTVTDMLHRAYVLPVMRWEDTEVAASFGLVAETSASSWDYVNLSGLGESVSQLVRGRQTGDYIAFSDGHLPFPDAAFLRLNAPRPSPLYGLLCTQLAGVLTSRLGWYRCSICGELFEATERKPHRGRSVLCGSSDCQCENDRRKSLKSYHKNKGKRPRGRAGSGPGEIRPASRREVANACSLYAASCKPLGEDT